MSAWRLALKSIRYDVGLYARIAALAAVIGFVIVALQLISATTSETVRQDTYAQALWAEAAVTPPPDAARAADALERYPDIYSVQSFTSSIGARDALVSDVTVTGVDSPVGRAPSWAAAALPRSVGQVAVSATVAESLQVAAGDRVSINGTDYEVSGILPTLADRRELSAVAFVDASRIPDDATVIWYADNAAVDGFMADEADSGLRARSVADHLEDDPFRSNARRLTSTFDGLAVPAAFAAAAALLGAIIALVRSRRSDVAALVAIGASRTAARSVFAVAAASTIGVAFAIGGLTAWVVAIAAKGWLGSVLGQTWVRVVVPVATLTRSFLIVGVIGAVGLVLFVRRPPPSPLSIAKPGTERIRIAASSIVLLMSSGYLVWLRTQRPAVGPTAVAVAALLAAAMGLSLPAVVSWVVRPAGPGVRRLLSTAGLGSVSAISIAPVILILTLGVSAELFTEYRQGIVRSEIPQNGLQLETVRPSDADALSAAYERLTGHQALVSLYPSEADPHTMFRVSDGASAACWKAQPTLDSAGCPTASMTTIGIPVSGYDESATWRIAPYLDDGSGKVTVIEFDPSDDTIRDVRAYDAVPDGSSIGTYANGAVTPTGSTLFEPDSNGPVLLPGFGDLDLATQAKVRRQIFDLAGYSLLAVSEVPDYGLLTLAWAAALFGLSATGALVVWWAVGLWRGDPTVTWFVASLPDARRVSRRLAWWCVAPVAIALVLSAGAAVAIGTFVLQIPIHSFVPFVAPMIMVFVLALGVSWLSVSSTLRTRDHTLGG